jgi:ABC-type multidrug transport system ATPase subunit
MNIIDIKNLSIYIKDAAILSNINLTIESGDFIFLKGDNGSGKSTFLNVLADYNPPNINYKVTGSIIFENQDILTIDDPFLFRQQIYYIQQKPEDSDQTVFQKFQTVMNIVHPITENDVKNFLHETDILPVFSNKNVEITPDKLLKRKFAQLSEGQKKLLEILSGIMRAQYMKLLLIDEPLNHLDTGNIKKVINLFTDLRKKNPQLAIIITTHCQAFPKPTKYLVANTGNIKISQVEYIHYACFD